ncbi:MAG TPA: flagellar hook protein FlgE [bacterium]|nr:flagellar hook protein FlgE [bacterium]
MFALNPGASGLNTYGEAMSVVGSNIANVNTTGFKQSRANFEDMLATGVAGTSDKIGKGVHLSGVQGDFTQGNLEGTNLITDMALEGDGFFTVRDRGGHTYYTRDGKFQFDKDGFLVTGNGQQVMVRDVDPTTKETTGFAHGAKVVGLNDPPVPTGDGTNGSGIKIQANLNSSVKPPKITFDPTNVQAEMYNFTSAVTVVDERGGEHVINVAFRKIPDQPPQINPANGQPIPGTGGRNQWQWFALVNGADVGGNPETQIAVSGGFLRFTDSGRLLQVTGGTFVQAGPGQTGPNGQIIPPGPPVLVEQPVNQAAGVPQVTIPFTQTPQVIGINFGLGSNPLDANDQRTGLDGVTQFNSESKVLNVTADGRQAGSLDNVDITPDGIITGYFDNGQVRPMYRVMLTRFVNNAGLLRRGDNEFEESLASGKPITGNPSVGGFSSVRPRNLEKSNVDLSTEFVHMIETQRAFQANAKSITTSDEMMGDLVAMKR